MPRICRICVLSPEYLQTDSVTQNQMTRVRDSHVVRGGLEADSVPDDDAIQGKCAQTR